MTADAKTMAFLEAIRAVCHEHGASLSVMCVMLNDDFITFGQDKDAIDVVRGHLGFGPPDQSGSMPPKPPQH